MQIKLPLILDGATGSQLIRRGLPAGVCPEQWILENEEALIDLQREYKASGSDLVLAPTFGASRHKLENYGIADKTEEFNSRLVELSRRAVGNDTLVASDVTATGLFIAPYGEQTMAELVEMYKEQLERHNDTDVVVSETNVTLADARAAVIAAKKTSDKPVFVTFTVDADGRTMTGATALSCLIVCRALGVSAFGFNCGFGPEEMLGVLESISEYAGALPLIAKPNAGMPKLVGGVEQYTMTPEELASYAEAFAKAGVRLFGGCCGTSPEHIKALSASVSSLSFEKREDIAEEYLATEREILPVSEVTLSEEISCSELLADDLMSCIDSCPLVRITSKADVAFFEENQYAAQNPVVIACDDESLLEAALVSWNGRAGVVSKCAEAKALAEFYGAILL